ncbi:hypothetical protein AgCh_039653 [Apium graveolens]
MLDTNNCDIDEIIDLATTLDDCYDLDPSPGDIIWAKVTGHSTWPAVVLNQSASSNLEGLNKISGEKSFLVQFFCTYDFARIRKKQVIPFLKGLLSDFPLKCKKSDFVLSLMEANMPAWRVKDEKKNLTLHQTFFPLMLLEDQPRQFDKRRCCSDHRHGLQMPWMQLCKLVELLRAAEDYTTGILYAVQLYFGLIL